MRYCPTCRTDFAGDNPPYSVIHVLIAPRGQEKIGDTGNTHLDPLTREEVEPLVQAG